MQRKKILLAGQQNAGKSTIFNMLTGARQHVANYPGVTVDKKTGYFSNAAGAFELIDLPGTYSLTSFSLEERVARKALREEQADCVLNVMDAANLSRSLHLTLQLLELELPVVVALNMMDVVRKEGMEIDADKLAEQLDLPVIECVGRLGKGVSEISNEIAHAKVSNFHIDYSELEPAIDSISRQLALANIDDLPSKRWLSLRLLENDQEAKQWLEQHADTEFWQTIEKTVSEQQQKLVKQLDGQINDYIVAQRQKKVAQLLDSCLTQVSQSDKPSITSKIDRMVLSRFGAPVFLIATVFIIYQSAIVYGYELTNYWWPYLAGFREIIAAILPDAGFLHDPYTRALGLWVVDSANTLLNYIPIFLILFALIAIIEDSGYMARIAFIADKALSKFGLHGQSTLPMILAGVFAGGCAVPGVMATKGIPDNRARLATILTVPFMNCLAKVPLYTLLLGIFFVEDKSLMTFYISTITIIAALLVAKLLTTTVLRNQQPSPFVMELPRYNLPTVRSVITRSIERTWIYIKKVGTIVLAVSTVIFVLLQFPGVPEESEAKYQAEAEKAVAKFERAIAKTDYAESITTESLPALVNFYTDFKRAKLNAKGAEASKQVNEDFKARDELFFSIIAPAKGDKSAKTTHRALRKVVSARKKIRREMKEERLEASLLGSMGRSLEPVTQYAGFDWKINVALFSSFAARESSVATLGVLFQQDEDSNQKLEDRMGESSELSDHGELAAVALILFFILYPPCLATVMMIKVQTGEYKWMLLSIFLPTALGFAVATAVYTIGTAFSLSGVAMMTGAYFTGLLGLIIIAMKDWWLKRKMPKEIPIRMTE
ncbi:ferrous iron transport protein B [Vibrio sp. LaRot3]|uniref:ferrous iron transport protein B n=1 Tax=Vibrio sp. LaRot3 TaxID=2998829 RepID=UPI0022CDEF63|nr:ferrous iron transport protein B [Vibrio sp. LaRot3]MDA0147088.1 ferrous iron transport protein B [Vibrio sp. LaRot3]